MMGTTTASLFAKSKLDLPTGILPSQVIRTLIDAGKIISHIPVVEEQIQPASIDLRLGREAYQVRASFLSVQSTVEKRIQDLFIRKIDLEGGAVFPKDSVFVVPLIESLDLPADVSGMANPKSTTGRLDIFTRLITEPGDEFEHVPKGYSGKLYLKIVSGTFPIVVRAGMKLSQLRFIRGNPPSTDGRLAKLAQREQLLYEDDDNPIEPRIKRGVSVSVDLQENGSNIVAYKAKKNTPAIDLANINYYDIDEFWDAIPSRPKGLILDPGDFYILASWERISVPPTHAAEMAPFDPSLGEFRIHYAGFFDPGFGYGLNGVKGTKAVLEVRAHEVPILLEDRQLVGKLIYHKMAKEPDKIYGPSIGSSYQQQGLALSKQFKQGVRLEQESNLASRPILAPPLPMES
jgi:dCTP deaminase